MKLKKFEQKDRYGNMFSIEFDTTVPEMTMEPAHPGTPKGTDTVPAWLTPGEFVINAEATRMFGPEIKKINDMGRAVQAEQGGTIPEYAAEGTMVGPVSRPKYGAAKSIYDKLIDEGFNHNAAVGIIANFQIESGLSPSQKQLNKKYANKYDDDGSLNKFFRTRPDDSYFSKQGFGLAQWTESRRKALEKFAKDNELPLNSANTQIDFMMKEMEGEYKNVKNKLASVQSPEEATTIFRKHYERAGKPAEDRRLAYAQELHNFITDDVTTAPILNPSEVLADEITTAPIPKPEIPVRIEDIDPYPTTYIESIQKMMENMRTKFKAEGGAINDPQADALNAYKEFAQQQTEDNGMFIGSEEVDEGGEYDGAAHLEEIDLMNQMQKERASNAMTMAPDEAIDTMGDIPELLAPPMTPTDTSGRESYRPGTVPLDTTSNDLTTGQPDLSSMFGGRYAPKTMELDEAIDTMPNTTIDASGSRNYRPGTVPLPNAEVPDLSSIFGGIYAPDSKRSNDLATEQQALKDKAQAEVDKTGQVSDETAAKVEKNIAERGFISQAEKAQANREEMQKNMAAKNAERMEERAYEEYLKQSQRAADAGVENYPSYEEWKVTQGLPEAPIKEEPSEKVAEQSEVLNKMINDIESIDDDTPVTLTEGDATGAVTNNAQVPEVQTRLEQAGSFLSGVFGDLFDTQELKRMAILYTGSRLLGNSHGGSLNYAAKGYLTRVDAKSTNHIANVNKLLEDGEYTPASIQKYSKTKDISVLTKKAAAVNPTGTKEMWYTPEGKRVQAEKFKVGDSYVWSADGGKTSIPAAWHQQASRIPTEDAYNDRIKSEVPLIKGVLEDVANRIDVTPGDSARGIKRTQKTAIDPTDGAMEVARWAAKNGIDVASASGYAKQAYQMAVQAATDNKDIKSNSLLPYLNQLKLRQDTGITELFDVPTKKGPAKPMDAVKIEELSLQFIKRAGGEGGLNVGRNRDAVNQFWTAAAEIWNEKTAANPDLIKQYERKAAPGETAFYTYAKEQLNLPM